MNIALIETIVELPELWAVVVNAEEPGDNEKGAQPYVAALFRDAGTAQRWGSDNYRGRFRVAQVART